MALLRGKGQGLECIFTGRDVEEALAELADRLSERPDFYRNGEASAVFGDVTPSTDQLTALCRCLETHGITLKGIQCPAQGEQATIGAGLTYLGPAPESRVTHLPQRRAAQAARSAALSESARSLVADFAGARADLAARRGVAVPAGPVAEVPAQAPVPDPGGASTLYHRGTLRGGQSLHHLGNIVVVGDVNPGAELVASGDIVVFGALRGVAHAGAQGERDASVLAVSLSPTQLRIATSIAADFGASSSPRGPECARVDGDRIVVTPYGDFPG